jgi:hypothetical protein
VRYGSLVFLLALMSGYILLAALIFGRLLASRRSRLRQPLHADEPGKFRRPPISAAFHDEAARVRPSKPPFPLDLHESLRIDSGPRVARGSS